MGIIWFCIVIIALSEWQVLTEPAYKNRKFYQSKEWRALRKRALEFWGAICMECEREDNITVDHICPRSKYPELELEFSNLQILCQSCNSRKGNRHNTDYRFN